MEKPFLKIVIKKEFDPTWVGDGRVVRIVKIEGIPLSELPERYTKITPRVEFQPKINEKDIDTLYIIWGEDEDNWNTDTIKVGDRIGYQYWLSLKAVIRQSKEAYETVMRELENIKKDWKPGEEETFEV